MAIKIEVSGFDANKIGKRIFNNDKVGLFSSQTAYRYMIPYVPMDTGTLYESVNINPFQIEFYQPYAHRMYEGVDFNFRKDKHPLATAHWDNVMMKSHSKDVSKEIEKFIERM